MFAPLVFSGLFIHAYAIKQAIIAFVLFSIGASAAYIVNDYFDINYDKQHPIKAKSRPLASGEVTILQAVLLLLALYSLLAIAGLYFPKIILIIYFSYFKTLFLFCRNTFKMLLILILKLVV